jgi:hypothetical protein
MDLPTAFCYAHDMLEYEYNIVLAPAPDSDQGTGKPEPGDAKKETIPRSEHL